MKKLIILILVLNSFILPAQSFRTWAKGNAVTWSCLILAGGCDGLAESVKFHYQSTDRKLNLNDNQWNPDISWRNKYKGGDPANGEKFLLSTRTLSFLTDGYHRTRAVKNLFIGAGIAFKIGTKQKWYYYLLDIGSYSLAYGIGFNLTYEYLR